MISSYLWFGWCSLCLSSGPRLSVVWVHTGSRLLCWYKFKLFSIHRHIAVILGMDEILNDLTLPRPRKPRVLPGFLDLKLAEDLYRHVVCVRPQHFRKGSDDFGRSPRSQMLCHKHQTVPIIIVSLESLVYSRLRFLVLICLLNTFTHWSDIAADAWG